MESDFGPYVPRLLIDWQASHPGVPVRAVEGTLAFVDMSGFTKMSERLGRRGKVGAEEVTDLINAIFGRLLGVAWDAGGGLLKFGGDALLLFFEGDQHAQRACNSTVAMRQALREFSRTRTSGGFVTLRMSAGIHSGAFDFFLAGDRHRELVITGPAATETVEMESTAVAGEIVVSKATAAVLGPACLGAAKGAGLLLKKSPPVMRAQLPPNLDRPAPDLTAFLPLAIRKRIGVSADHGEHRQVTTAFIHFSGVDALMASGGTEAVHSRLQELMAAVQEAAFEFDLCFLATDIDRDGGKIILTAGAPESFEHDEERALRAARAIIEQDHGLSLRIGVNRGRIFAGEIGPAFRRTYTVMGDAVNLAARLMAAARPGQVVTTADVLERSRAVFESGPLGPLFLKGKSRPVEAYAVGPASRGISRESSGAALPLVGRDAELADLDSAVARASKGDGLLVQVVGEPGLGKSRLIEEFKSRCEGLEYFSSASEQYESSTPYFAFRPLLMQLLEIPAHAPPQAGLEQLRLRVRAADPELEPRLPLLALPLDLPASGTEDTAVLDASFRKTGIHRAVERLLEKLLPSPTVIVFEDVHWMDEASTDLLHYLAATVNLRPWVICVTRRDQLQGFVPSADVEHMTIRLEPLSSEESMRLTAAASDETPLAQHVMTALTERAAGNPLFLQQLIQAARTDGADAALPDNVEAAITTRIDRLAPRDRRILRYASVIGPSFSPNLLFRMIEDGAPTGPAAFRNLGEFVREEGPDAIQFKHSLYREVAYEGLPYRARRELHAQVGTVLEDEAGPRSDEIAELLSLHFFRAQRFDKAWRYSGAAGRRARSKFSNVQAAEFFRRAIDSAKRLSNVAPFELAEIWEALGDVSELAGLYTEAAVAYRSGRALAARAGASTTPFLLKEGVVRDRLGLYSQALRWYTRGLRTLANDEPLEGALHQRIQFSLAIAAARYRQGRHDECIRWCQRVILEAGGATHRASLARAYYLLDNAYTDLGRAESSQYRALALPIFEELGDLIGQANVLNNLGVDAYYEGRWDEALVFYQRSKEARDRAGDIIGAATATNNIAEILSDQGHLEEAEPQFREALRIWRAAGYSVGVALATSNLGRLASRAGRFEEARRLLDEALAAFERIRAGNFVLETKARIAETHVFEGRDETAQPIIDSLLADVEAGATMFVWQQAIVHRLRGYTRLQAGDQAAARASFEESLRLGRSVNAEYEVGLTLEGMALRLRMMHPHGSNVVGEGAHSIFQHLGVVWTPAVPSEAPSARAS